MKIAASAVALDSGHARFSRQHISESLLAPGGALRPGAGNEPRSGADASTVTLSSTGKNLQSEEMAAIDKALSEADNDPKLNLIRAMVALLTGREVDLVKLRGVAPATADSGESTNPAATPASPQTPANASVTYERRESYSEAESTQFTAQGLVKTADGRELNFSLSLSMTRSYHAESNVSLRLDNAPRTKDPLVLNFNGQAAQLTSQRFLFDLDADGKKESINFVAGGSGFLAIDRNGDGKVNDGTELFGVKSGDGFADLAALDADGNGWIDENDPAYSQLRVWTKDVAGKDSLSTLKAANVGALNLSRVASPFDLKNAANALQGQIRSSGVFLHEDGRAGTMQQVDLTV